ncbi:hypothetical protein [Bradyrhizobium retamae]|uniref:N-acetyltransferase domain-containing protein n=1 Tax=Bradyrhizobium retamae TaxID=1300035 RepID=A0A0R3MX99_9BRAD|nr:hypothetical protein [Bradyrhizobium retamae]KRR21926.1 hypothetical protein CQ13_07780 [Bradyrhizobium retamae]
MAATYGYLFGMGALEQAADPDARRYEIQREAARHFAELKAAELVKYRLMPPEAAICSLRAIDDAAIAAAASWEFQWRRIMGQTRPFFRRFEAALWCNGNLYGLVVGRASRGPDNVTVHYLERAANDNPFAGFFAQIAVDAADNYAKLIGRQRVKLKNPVAGVIPTYQAMNFSIAETIKGNIYYARQVM